MNTHYALSTATCSLNQVPSAFKQIVDEYMAANPGKTIVAIQHSTCSIGSPMSPYLLLTVQFTATSA